MPLKLFQARWPGGAPVVDADPGPFFEGLLESLEDIGFHGAVDDDFTFFLALGDKFGVLGEEKRRKKTQTRISGAMKSRMVISQCMEERSMLRPTSLSRLAALVLRRQFHRRYER